MMIQDPPYYLTAYGIAVKHGYQGTEEEWLEDVYGGKLSAEKFAKAAAKSASDAGGYAHTASEAAIAAEQSKQGAKLAKQAADSDAAAAAASKNAAASSATSAAASAAQAQVQAGMAYKIAATAAAMTDHDVGYVYVGSDTGYVYGSWYYWNGSAWTVGGTAVDPSLLTAGAAADAKTVGDLRANVSANLPMLYYEQGGYGVNEGEITLWTTNERVRTPFVDYGDTVLRVKKTTDYTVFVFKLEDGVYSSVRTISADDIFPVATYSNASFAFVVRKTADDTPITVAEAVNNVSITPAETVYRPVANGLEIADVELYPGVTMTAGTAVYAHTDSDRACSYPIPIPQTGMRIAINPAKREGNHVVPFRCVFLERTDSGFAVIATSDEVETDEGTETVDRDQVYFDLYAASTCVTATGESVYIPYVEGVYAVICVNTYDDVSELDKALFLYAGEITSYSGSGRPLGLWPVYVYMNRSNNLPVITRGSDTELVNTSRYYGGFLWLHDVKSLTIGPRHTGIVVVYQKTNTEPGYVRAATFWCNENAVENKITGVQYVDLRPYNFDGWVQFAIQDTVHFGARGVASPDGMKVHRGMGVMGRYWEVMDDVYVEYKNNIQQSVEPGLPSVIYDNANAFMRYTYPLRKASVYFYEHEARDTSEPNDGGHPFDEVEDASPAFYSGSFDANEIFLNVSGQSYYTAMANVNSRCYQFARPRDGAKGRLGYGLTCTDFVSVMLGMRENYPTAAMAFYTPKSFRQISNNWNYLTDMDQVRPGDVLTEYVYRYLGDKEGGEVVETHSMLVYEKKYINGQLECLTVIEAGRPYSRFMCMYNEKYIPRIGTWQSLARLSSFHFLARPKPEYIHRISEVFDLSTAHEPRTLQCDRGKHSIYCVNPKYSGSTRIGYEVESTAVIITVDPGIRSFFVCAPGAEPVEVTVPEDATTVDIRDTINTINTPTMIPGRYELKLAPSDTEAEESFWLQGPVEFSADAWVGSGADKRRTVHVGDLSALRYAAVYYSRSVSVYAEQESAWKSAIVRSAIIVLPEEITPDGEGGGTFTAYYNRFNPVETDTVHDPGGEYMRVKFVYGVEADGVNYGTFQVRAEKLKTSLLADPEPAAYVEYDFAEKYDSEE